MCPRPGTSTAGVARSSLSHRNGPLLFSRPGALLRESGMWDATPSLGHLFSKAPAKFVSDERP